MGKNMTNKPKYTGTIIAVAKATGVIVPIGGVSGMVIQ
jgi:hypothetical protein